MSDPKDRFGWGPGEAWIELEDGTRERIGEIPESAKEILKKHDEEKSKPE